MEWENILVFKSNFHPPMIFGPFAFHPTNSMPFVQKWEKKKVKMKLYSNLYWYRYLNRPHPMSIESLFFKIECVDMHMGPSVYVSVSKKIYDFESLFNNTRSTSTHYWPRYRKKREVEAFQGEKLLYRHKYFQRWNESQLHTILIE